MNKQEIYRKNEKIFDSGIDAEIDKNPYDMTPEELNLLENRLRQFFDETGIPYVFVEWGQPFGGPVSGHKYHPKTEIENLSTAYEQHNLRGICPKAGFAVGAEWIPEQRENLKKLETNPPKPFDWDAYWKFAENIKF